MADILTQTIFPEQYFDFDIEPIDSSTTGSFDGDPVNGETFIVSGLINPEVITAFDACFFPNSNACEAMTWSLVSGVLPSGVTLDPTLGLQVTTTTQYIVVGTGPSQFTIQVEDECGNILTYTYYPVNRTTPEPDTDDVCTWELGELWTQSPLCARLGNYGLRRVANGILGTSDANSTTQLEVEAGQVYFLRFWYKTSGGADGTYSFGFKFYDSSSVFLSEASIGSGVSQPTDWTEVAGNITVPVNAVLATPYVRATNHLAGTVCIDSVYATRGGFHFELSSIRHYFSPFSAFRGIQ